MDQHPTDPGPETWKWTVKPETGNDEEALPSTEQTTTKFAEAAVHDACAALDESLGSALDSPSAALAALNLSRTAVKPVQKRSTAGADTKQQNDEAPVPNDDHSPATTGDSSSAAATSVADGNDTEHTVGFQKEKKFVEMNSEFSAVRNNMSEIRDPALKRMIPIPDSNEEKKEILTRLFFSLTKASCFRTHKVNLVEFFQWTPKTLWDSVFTAAETEAMVKTQQKKMDRSIMARFRTVFETWRTLEGNPMATLPTTMAELIEAKTKKPSDARRAWIEAMLMRRNPRTDAWLAKIYEEFLDTLVLEELLDRDRRRMALDLSIAAEFFFRGPVLKVVEVGLAGGYSTQEVKLMVEGLHTIQIPELG